MWEPVARYTGDDVCQKPSTSARRIWTATSVAPEPRPWLFSVTKAIHDGLQGAARELTPTERETYLTHSARNARLLEAQYDLVVVHDPQPLALLRQHGKGTARWVRRS